MLQDDSHFTPQKANLICVDSDGCAMDTMDIKHIRCFGPSLVDEWDLHPWEKEVLARWNEINLYSLTRGTNRFRALAALLTELDRQLGPVEDLCALQRWVHSAPQLSNPALEREAARTGSVCLYKALHWSRMVNERIARLPDAEKRPFPGAREALAAAHGVADVAVVSSANAEALRAEWRGSGLGESVDLLLGQEAGSKADCLAALRQLGYDPDRILMVGDAPGDLDAARSAGVHFYPICVRGEARSWAEAPEAFAQLAAGTYAQAEPQKIADFEYALGAR